MKLTLHIGMTATSGTAFQEWAHINTDGLKVEGVWNAQATQPPMQNGIVAIAGIDDAATDAIDGLTREVEVARESGMRVFLLSCPQHFATLNPDALKAAVADLFDEVDIVVFVRPQVDEAIEKVLLAHSGDDVIPDALVRDTLFTGDVCDRAFDYHAVLQQWARVFGKSSINVVAYRQSNPTKYFQESFGLIRDDYRPVHNEVAVSNSHLRALKLVTKVQDWDGALNLDWEAIFSGMQTPEQPHVSVDLLRDLHGRFEGQNDQLCKDWPSLSVTDMTPDFDAYSAQEGPAGGKERETADALRDLVSQLLAENKRRRASEEMLQAQLALSNANSDRAERLVRRSERWLRDAKEIEPTHPENGALRRQIGKLKTQLSEAKQRQV